MPPRISKSDGAATSRGSSAIGSRTSGSAQNLSLLSQSADLSGDHVRRGGQSKGRSGSSESGQHPLPARCGAHFNLAIAYGAQGNENEIAEYRRALELDPDLAPAYLNWGAALYAKGRRDEAITVYRRGIEVNPLVAGLHYSLSIALDQEGKKQEAEAEMTLARKIDPHL